VDDRGAGSECSVLIYYGHNSHSLFSYTVDLEAVDHGHMRLGYELSNGSTVHAIALCTVHYRSGAECRRYSSVMVIPAQCTGIATAGKPTSNC